MTTPLNPLKIAVDVVAWEVIRRGVEMVEWDDFPNIGEHDWSLVIARATWLAETNSCGDLLLNQALALLDSRAENSEDET